MPDRSRKVAIGAALAVCVACYALWFWGLAFSALVEPSARPMWPSELLRYAEVGTPREVRLLWLTLGVVLLVPLALAIATLGKPRPLHGDAKFGREADVRRAELRADAGVVLGSFGGKPLIASGEGNILGCAPPGGGKGVGWVIPTLLQWPDSAIVLDVKHENFQRTAGFRARCGQRVFFIDPLNRARVGHRFNPLAEIGDGDDRIDNVERIATMLIPEPTSSDPYWALAARDLFRGIVLALAELRDDHGDAAEPVTLGSVYRFLMGGQDVQKLCAATAEDLGNAMARGLLLQFATLAKKQADGVSGVLQSRITLWGNPTLDAATAASDFSFSDLRRVPSTIYLGVTPDNLQRLAPFLALVVQQAVDALTRRLPGADEPHRVLLLMDEFAMLGRMQVLQAAMAFLRGYGGRVFPIIQSPAQLDEHYGAAGRRALFDTCKYRVLYPPNDLETAATISKELGTYTTKTESRSKPLFMSSKGGYSKSISVAKRELLLPHEVLQLDRSKLILFVEGMRPIFGDKIRYFAEREMRRRSEVPHPALPPYPSSTSPAPAPASPGNPMAALAAEIADETLQELATTLRDQTPADDTPRRDELQAVIDSFSAAEAP